MASGIFAILDDIAALMDDVAVTAKFATKKTAGILGDDLAVNAEKATGFLASREIPVLWAVTKGSLLNKLIIVPLALLLNASLLISAFCGHKKALSYVKDERAVVPPLLTNYNN